VRRPNERCAKIDRPEGVILRLQVESNKVEPVERTVNLLSKDRLRASEADEVEEGGPEVPLVSKPLSFACRAERLAWAGSAPSRSFVGPSCGAHGEGPPSDPGEEMALGVSHKVGWLDIFDAPFVHVAGRDHPLGYKLPKPLGGGGVDLVVIGARLHR